jgi:hypothetical protein
MTQKEKLMRWFEFNNFSVNIRGADITAQKNILVKTRNEVYRILIEFNENQINLKFLLKRKLDNSPSYSTIFTDYISIFMWEKKIKDILTKSKLIRNIRMAEPKAIVTQDEVTNDTVSISVEDAKRILQAEEQKQSLKMEQCKNEIEEILKKYEVDLVTIIDKPAVSKLVNEFLTNEKANYFILHPEIRNLSQVQQQEA